jgi:diketogulonate reductase-like aldo/keto reductase
MNVSWQQEKLRHFCREKGIQVSAWSPLGANGASWGTLDVMESPVLKDIAITKEKSVPQVLYNTTYSIFCVCVESSSFYLLLLLFFLY